MVLGRCVAAVCCAICHEMNSCVQSRWFGAMVPRKDSPVNFVGAPRVPDVHSLCRRHAHGADERDRAPMRGPFGGARTRAGSGGYQQYSLMATRAPLLRLLLAPLPLS